MSVENALNFCNQYLMLKTLTHLGSDQGKNSKVSGSGPSNIKKKVGKGQKFQNPTKKVLHQESEVTNEYVYPEKVKTKKKKFQGGSFKKQVVRSPEVYQKSETKQKEEGYVPIQNLLSQLSSRPEKKAPFDNFRSFGESQWQDTSNNYRAYQNFQYQNNQPNLWQQLESKFDTSWMYSQQPRYQSASGSNLNKIRSQYLFESPLRENQRFSSNYCVPASRSRIRNLLQNSQSCTNLETYSQNRSFNIDQQSKSKSKRKKNSQRQFYVPLSSNGPKQQIAQNQMSRCTSTNNIIAKLQKQILDQKNFVMKNQQQQQEEDKSHISDTRFETKNKIGGKQFQEFSTIRLDNRVRESLSFISEAAGPPKPINIQLTK